MGFDLDSPPISRGVSHGAKLMTTKEHLEELKKTNAAFGELFKASPPKTPRSARHLQSASADLAKVDGTVQAEMRHVSQGWPSSPLNNLPATSWGIDLFSLNALKHHPRRVLVKVSKVTELAASPAAARKFVIGDGNVETSVLQPETTAGDVLQLVRRQLLPGPHTEMLVELWGVRLDESQTLEACGVKDGATLNVRLVDHRPVASDALAEGPTRLRITSSALGTRELRELPERCDGAELRARVAEMFSDGIEQSWWNKDGKMVSVSGALTMLATETAPAVENGTDAIRQGEEVSGAGQRKSHPPLALRPAARSATAPQRLPLPRRGWLLTADTAPAHAASRSSPAPPPLSQFLGQGASSARRRTTGDAVNVSPDQVAFHDLPVAFRDLPPTFY